MDFFKQNIVTEKRLSIAHVCVLEVQGMQNVSAFSPQPEGLSKYKKENKGLPFPPTVLFSWFSYC